MNTIKIENIIIGQEAVCGDGLGRVAAVDRERGIYIKTYIENRGCWWDACNVRIIPLNNAMAVTV